MCEQSTLYSVWYKAILAKLTVSWVECKVQPVQHYSVQASWLVPVWNVHFEVYNIKLSQLSPKVTNSWVLGSAQLIWPNLVFQGKQRQDVGLGLEGIFPLPGIVHFTHNLSGSLYCTKHLPGTVHTLLMVLHTTSKRYCTLYTPVSR